MIYVPKGELIMSKNPFSKDEKKFSLCVPCHGDKWRHFDKFFEALDLQEHKNFETIVTFDGKNGKGEKELKKMKEKYPKLDISFHTIEHAGACAARNNSVKHATGDYYAFPSPDCFLYPETLRMWANEFEDKKVNRVWGMYDIIDDNGNIMFPVGQAPVRPDGSVWYEGFKFSPYADATFPIRKEAYVDWDVNCKSLNDWEYSIRLLKKTNFKGDDWKYVPYHFFSAETPQKGGLSDDSAQNWEDRRKYVREVNGIEDQDIVVTSLGAQSHAFNVSELLGADFLPMPSFKPHHYKAVYLLGFYLREHGESRVTQTHIDVFTRNKGVNIVHWIGTDIYDLRWHCSFEKIKALKKWFKENNVIHLCEAEFTKKELAEVGIDAKVVPIPPKKIYEPMLLPEKFTVGVYLPDSTTYMPNTVMEVVKAMPDVDFKFFGNEDLKGNHDKNWEHIGYVDLDEWMPKLSCNLRLTVHDGLPITPLQFLTAGRTVVSNTPIKGAIKVTNEREDIIKGIRKAQKEPLDPKVSEYWSKELDVDKYKRAIRRFVS
jgi:hypothetical protein